MQSSMTVIIIHGYGKTKIQSQPICLSLARLSALVWAKLSITSFLFCASISASLCCSNSCNICFSMIFLASSTRRFTSASISSFRFSSSSSTRFATSSSTRRATSSSISFSSSSFCFLGNYKHTNEPPHDKTNKVACAPSKDSDQPGHLPSPIRVFAVLLWKHWTLRYPLNAQRRLIRLGRWVHRLLLVLSCCGSNINQAYDQNVI